MRAEEIVFRDEPLPEIIDSQVTLNGLSRWYLSMHVNRQQLQRKKKKSRAFDMGRGMRGIGKKREEMT